MTTRRHFFRTATATGAALAGAAGTRAQEASPALPGDDRAAWVHWLVTLSGPVLTAGAEGRLKRDMPVEAAPGSARDRRPYSHLEAVGRTLAGAAPWLAGAGGDDAERKHRERLAEAARGTLRAIVEPGGVDSLDFTAGAQCLVDAAFLALGLLRGRSALWEPLDAAARARVAAALASTRRFKPGQNNWLLFSATVEAFLASIGEKWQPEPISTALDAHETWYKGDGSYGDGPQFHWDYYNSFVIQPMLLAVLETIAPVDGRWQSLLPRVKARALRHAAVLERLVAPDGSFPVLGRSMAYRCGAFHHLANMAWRRELPEHVTPAQVRGALAAVIARTLDAPATFDAAGWLRIGLSGHQPALAEGYISTGSLYLSACAFLPLGLPPEDGFWASPAAPWTAKKAWAGIDLPADHALSGH